MVEHSTTRLSSIFGEDPWRVDVTKDRGMGRVYVCAEVLAPQHRRMLPPCHHLLHSSALQPRGKLGAFTFPMSHRSAHTYPCMRTLRKGRSLLLVFRARRRWSHRSFVRQIVRSFVVGKSVRSFVKSFVSCRKSVLSLSMSMPKSMPMPMIMNAWIPEYCTVHRR